MNAKKLMSLLTAICLIVSCFAGVVSAEEATLPAISAADVKAATLSADADSTITAVATAKTDYIEVAISSEKLKAHDNANTESGYWAGFALVAPEGVNGFKYDFADKAEDLVLSGVNPLEENVADGKAGAAFYVDASQPDSAKYVQLQWTKDGADASLAATFKMNLDGVKLDEETFTKGDIYVEYLDKKSGTVDFYGDENVSVDFSKIKMEHGYTGPVSAPNIVKAKISEANVVDQDNVDVKPYTSYKVSYEYDEEYADWCTISIKMDGLKLHNSDGAGKGFWTGFSVKAPEGAKYLSYYKSFGRNAYSHQQIELAEGQTEESFYLNVAECYDSEWIDISWYDKDHNVVSDVIAYDIDLSGIKLAADANVFEKAVVADYFLGSDETAPAEVYSTYNVKETNGVIDIDMKGLVLHKNGNGDIGFWTGFSVKVPEGAKKLSYYKSFGDSYSAIIDLGTDTEVSFYIDVEDYESNDERDYETDEKLNEYVVLQWLDAEDNAISRENYYELDIDGVNVVYPDDSKIGKAIVADYNTGEIPYDTYDVVPEGNTVVLKAQNLKSHKNGAQADGHWIGFTVEAPEGATHYEYRFMNYEGEVTRTSEVTALEENETSISFYVNASAPYAKEYVRIQWYKGEEREYSYYPEYFYINIDDVDLADDKAVEVTEAIVADRDSADPVYTSYDVEDKKDGTVKITAKGLKTHRNGNGKLGAWIGAKVSKPDGAEYVKYFFGEYKASWDEAEYRDAADILDEDGTGVSFYFDAFDMTPKNTIMIQWFDENDVAITNRYVYTLDISGVEYKVKPEAKMTVTKANIVDQANVDIKPYLGEYDAKLDGDTIVLSADLLKIHENANTDYGAWIGFTPNVEGAKYVKYVFDSYGWDDWYYDSDVVEAGESFYVDADDDDYKDTITLQFFDENGKALTNVNTYNIDIENVQVEDDFPVNYSKIELAGDNARLYNLADSTHYEWVSTADYVYVDTFAYNGKVELSVEGTDESNGGNVFYRNADRKVTLTATPDSGYRFVGWYEGEEKIESKATIELTLDKCYELEASFAKGSSNTPGNGNGGGLAAGGDKGTAGSDNLGPKDEGNKTEGSIVPSAPAFFVDVPASEWYYSVVKEAYDKGLMNGVSASTFAPTQSLTRGMFVTILYRLAGSPAVEAAANFADVPANQYYADAVAWASANSIVNGVSADKFAPNNNITREQMATIIHRYATANNIEAANSNEVSYSDSASISAFAKAAVEWASSAGVLSGNSDGTFAPLRTATRAEAAAIFVRLLGLIG